MQLRNRLWKPEGKSIKNPSRVENTRDPICSHCCKKLSCSPGPCLFITRVNGNVERKEALMSDLCTQEMEYTDYKESLAELMEDRKNRINNTANIQNPKRRAITILLLAGITQQSISTMFSMSYRQINRIANNNK